MTKITNRILDANINRAKEGLRVCEEIARFMLASPRLTEEFKKIRHQIDTIVKSIPHIKNLINARESSKDVGWNIYVNELKRKNFKDVFFANIQRIKESVRVLEEFSKLENINRAIRFKKIRYVLYELEKKTAQRISALCNH